LQDQLVAAQREQALESARHTRELIAANRVGSGRRQHESVDDYVRNYGGGGSGYGGVRFR
jgi:hypothetical protein